MKSYIQGLITGGVLVFAIIVFMGAGESKEVGRYQAFASEFGDRLIDTKTGDLYNLKWFKLEATWDKQTSYPIFQDD
ncbi:uncharacterized protein METZ01_LOCUS491850 [marine metagenome]|uniref:Uncharacterized protein n=1 Tax=marine metagenome TaxID=408172 RepID=A0A383D373_9ZZZZ